MPTISRVWLWTVLLSCIMLLGCGDPLMPVRHPYYSAEQKITPDATRREDVRKLLGEPWFAGDEWGVDIYFEKVGTMGLAGIVPVPTGKATYSCLIVYHNSGLVRAIRSAWMAHHPYVHNESTLRYNLYMFDMSHRKLQIPNPGNLPSAYIHLTDAGNIYSVEAPQQLIAYTRDRAEEGDPVAQLRLYNLIDDPENLFWLCRAADQGYPAAQKEVGRLYWEGLRGVRRNRVRAHVWFSLSASTDHNESEVQEMLAKYDKEMTSEQIAEAERELATWTPGQCQVELVK